MRPLLALLVLLAAPVFPTFAQSKPESVEAQLCRNQLELLLSRQRLTEAEQSVFQAQCDCLDQQAKSGDQMRPDCAQPQE